MNCKYCGSRLAKDALFCPNCGAKVDVTYDTNDNKGMGNDFFEKIKDQFKDDGRKSKILVFAFAFFLGGFGVHNFYLGYTKKGITQLLLTTIGALIFIGPFISATWSFIEGLLYLFGNDKRDANGVPLK